MPGSPWAGRQRVHVRDGRQRFRAASRVRVGGSPGVGGGTGRAEHAQCSGAGGAAAFPWCGLRRAEPCVPVLGLRARTGWCCLCRERACDSRYFMAVLAVALVVSLAFAVGSGEA